MEQKSTMKYFNPLPETEEALYRMRWDLQKNCNDTARQEIEDEFQYILHGPIVCELINQWLPGENHDRKYSPEDIAFKVREFVSTNYPECKFRCNVEIDMDGRPDYGSSIEILLMAAPQPLFYYSGLQQDNKWRKIFVNGLLINERFNDSGLFLTDYGKTIIASIKSYMESHKGPHSNCLGEIVDGKWSCSEECYGVCESYNFAGYISIGDEYTPFRIEDIIPPIRLNTLHNQ